MSAFATGLWPFTEITAGVAVMNGAKIGNLGSTIAFKTPEGGKFFSSSQSVYIYVFKFLLLCSCIFVHATLILCMILKAICDHRDKLLLGL